MFTSSPTIDRGRAGFTLVEVLVGLGLVVFLMLTLTAILEQYALSHRRQETQSQYRLDTAVLERHLFDDLVGAFPSFGNLKTPDTALASLEFFEYFGSLATLRIPQTNQTREFTLDATKNNSIEIICEAWKFNERRYYDPAQAYGDLYFAAPLRYLSANQKEFFSKQYADHWNMNGHFFFYAPAALQELGSTAAFPPVRYYSFLGFRIGNDIRPDTMGGAFKVKHPVMNFNIASFDQFLRLIPSLGGAMAQLLVVPVNVVRYRIAFDRQLGSGRVYRAVKSQGEYRNEILAAEGVDKIVFRRSDVTSRRVDYQIHVKK